MITYVLIAVTVVVSYICFNNKALFEKLAFVPYLVVKKKQWYRLITHGFVHADSVHLLVNMFTFWSFGVYIERIFDYMGFGAVNFLILYFGGMVVSCLYDLIKRHDNPSYASIGASGAVSAVLFSSIFFDPWAKILLFAVIPVPGIIFGFIYLAYCQYMARRSKDNINHNAHFYGAMFGFIYPILLNPSLIRAFLSHF